MFLNEVNQINKPGKKMFWIKKKEKEKVHMKDLASQFIFIFYFTSHM